MGTLHNPSNCAVKKSDKQKKIGYVHFSYFYLHTFVCERFYVSQLFTGGMFMMWETLYAWRERDKQCPGGRLLSMWES